MMHQKLDSVKSQNQTRTKSNQDQSPVRKINSSCLGGGAVPERAGAEGSGSHPLILIDEKITSHNHVTEIPGIKTEQVSGANIGIQKCGCNHVWCPSCAKKKSLPAIQARMENMQWDHVRQVVLTIDPQRYPDPAAVYDEIRNKKALAGMINNLERTVGIKIIDWMWVLEWHRSGHAHWHVLIEVDQAGRAAMIGQENIQKYWLYGKAYEKYFKNETHWKRFSGYFGKHGYFNKKEKHQSILPEWARESRITIRRTGSKVMKKTDEQKRKAAYEKQRKATMEQDEKQRLESLGVPGDQPKVGKRQKEKNRVILDACGEYSRVIFEYGRVVYLKEIKVAYRDLRGLAEWRWCQKKRAMIFEGDLESVMALERKIFEMVPIEMGLAA